MDTSESKYTKEPHSKLGYFHIFLTKNNFLGVKRKLQELMILSYKVTVNPNFNGLRIS